MKRRILFVDDEQNILDGFRRMLFQQTKEWDMTFINCPNEASRELKEHTFDAAVIDLKMAGKNGFVLLGEIKNNPKLSDMEVIVMTGLEDKSLKRQALNFGAADLLNKPIQREDLIARLRNVLRMKSYKNKLGPNGHVLEQQINLTQQMKFTEYLASRITHDFDQIMMILKEDNGMGKFFESDSKTSDGIKTMNAACEQARELVNQIVKTSQEITYAIE